MAATTGDWGLVMAHFYGQVKGSASTTASRGGTRNSGLRVSAQTYDGSVIVAVMDGKNDGEPVFTIEVDDGSSFYGNEVFSGTIAELVRALRGNAD